MGNESSDYGQTCFYACVQWFYNVKWENIAQYFKHYKISECISHKK